MSRERELLERALVSWDDYKNLDDPHSKVMEEIRAYLAEHDAKPLSEVDIGNGLRAWANTYRHTPNVVDAFIGGAVFAEKHHGIGGKDES